MEIKGIIAEIPIVSTSENPMVKISMITRMILCL